MSRRILPPDDVLFALVEQGIPCGDIAAMFPKVSASMVSDRMRKFPKYHKMARNNWLRKQRLPRRWTPDKMELVVMTYRKYKNLAKTCRALKTNKRAVTLMLEMAQEPLLSQSEVQTGKDSSHWKGGRTIDKNGYVLLKVYGHPYANVAGYVREHRLVMEKALGRYLLPKEVVHHKNKDRSDNRLENLQLHSTNAEHLAEELKGKCPQWTEDGKRRIAEGIEKAAELKRRKYHPKNDDPA